MILRGDDEHGSSTDRGGMLLAYRDELCAAYHCVVEPDVLLEPTA